MRNENNEYCCQKCYRRWCDDPVMNWHKCANYVPVTPKEEEHRYIITARTFKKNSNLPFLETDQKIELTGPLTESEAHQKVSALRHLHIRHICVVRLSNDEYHYRLLMENVKRCKDDE